MNAPLASYEDAPLFDGRKIVATLFARRWLLIVCGFLSALAFGVIAFTMDPVYRSSVVLVPVDRSGAGLGGALGRLDGLASVIGLGMGARGNDTAEAIAVLESREFNEKFIVKYQLLPRLFQDKWDAQNKRWNLPAGKEPTLAKAFKRFDEGIREVIQDRKTGLVTIQVDWKDRNEAATWSNLLVSELNAEMRKRAVVDADASQVFLEKELAQTGTVATRDAISRLIESQIKQRMLANVTQEYAFRVVDRALPPDAGDVLRPRKFRLIAIGGVVGFALAALWILVSGSLRGAISRPGGGRDGVSPDAQP